MFAGEFKHAIDSKNRLVIPNKFRVFITEEQDKKGFFVVAGLARDRCLRLYTPTKWEKVIDKVRREADKRKVKNGGVNGIRSAFRLAIPNKAF